MLLVEQIKTGTSYNYGEFSWHLGHRTGGLMTVMLCSQLGITFIGNEPIPLCVHHCHVLFVWYLHFLICFGNWQQRQDGGLYSRIMKLNFQLVGEFLLDICLYPTN